MSVRVVIATGNTGKVREFRGLLAGSGLDAIAPADAGVGLEVEESGRSYMENALIKARAYSAAAGLPALADDSGLEVEALGGAPGIHSARYGGPGLADGDRTALLLERLSGIPESRRKARYCCALALCLPDGRTWPAEGTCEGIIAAAPHGARGFGYDPIFLIPAFGLTMAELEPRLKNQLSHRGRAVRALLQILGGAGCDLLESRMPESAGNGAQ